MTRRFLMLLRHTRDTLGRKRWPKRLKRLLTGLKRNRTRRRRERRAKWVGRSDIRFNLSMLINVAATDATPDISPASSQPQLAGSGPATSAEDHHSCQESLWFEVDGQSATLDDIAKQVREESTPPPKPAPKPRLSVNSSTPRLGIEDSGNWSFVLAHPHGRDTKAVGWRTADVIYETSSSYKGAHSIFSFM